MPQNDDKNLVIDLGVLSAEPADEYHAKAGEYLSSHHLLDFMACPWLYRKKQLGLIADSDTPAMLVGRAAHARSDQALYGIVQGGLDAALRTECLEQLLEIGR